MGKNNEIGKTKKIVLVGYLCISLLLLIRKFSALVSCVEKEITLFIQICFSWYWYDLLGKVLPSIKVSLLMLIFGKVLLDYVWEFSRFMEKV
jgi:hypothetical protein